MSCGYCFEPIVGNNARLDDRYGLIHTGCWRFLYSDLPIDGARPAHEREIERAESSS